ncbi:MAG: DUF4358 domain-containing protein [Oscillospiraceae bacterium]|nr:DUF4358 domain-containing protein [Oscillospiraceae bacterium]
MKHRTLLTLAAAGALLLAHPACSPQEPEATPTPDPLPTESMNVIVTTPEAQPTESMDVIVTSPEPDPTESVNVIAPEESDNPVKPLESQGPVQSHPVETQAPTPEPTSEPEPTPEAPAASLTAADAYAKVSAVAGGNAMSDMGFVLEEFYNLSTDDLEDFAFYMPEMSATNEEIFIAKVKSGKMDAVKEACESRHQGLKEEGAMYPTAAEYVESARIVTNGDWIMFAVVANPAEAESAFNDYTK